MSAAKTTRFRGKNIGFVFQQFNLLPTLTAGRKRLCAALASTAFAVPKRWIVRGRCSSASVWAIGRKRYRRDCRVGSNSVSQSRGALVHEPRLLVCDEPTSALDHTTGHNVMNMLRELALNAGRSVVIVTHDARIFEFADQIAHMDDGSIRKLERGKSRVSEDHAEAEEIALANGGE